MFRQTINGMCKKAATSFENMQAIIHHEIEASIINLLPEGLNGSGVALVHIKSLDAVFSEQDIAVYIRTIDHGLGEIITPNPKGCARAAAGAHI